jgi:hypothetical protein
VRSTGWNLGVHIVLLAVLVLTPSKDGKVVRFKVRLDGAAPGNDHGVDSKSDGIGEIRKPRMYQLIRQQGEVQDPKF